MSHLQPVPDATWTRTCAFPGCGALFTQPVEPKRPRLYCGETCKRRNAAEKRKQRRQLGSQRRVANEQATSAGLAPMVEVEQLSGLAERLSAPLAVLERITKPHPPEILVRSPKGYSPETLARTALVSGRRVRRFLARLPESSVEDEDLADAHADLDQLFTAAAELAAIHDAWPPQSWRLAAPVNPLDVPGDDE